MKTERGTDIGRLIVGNKDRERRTNPNRPRERKRDNHREKQRERQIERNEE